MTNSEVKKPLSTSSSATMSPDLSTAMETMKAALAAQDTGQPVMEMFNTLFQSVVSVSEFLILEVHVPESEKKYFSYLKTVQNSLMTLFVGSPVSKHCPLCYLLHFRLSCRSFIHSSIQSSMLGFLIKMSFLKQIEEEKFSIIIRQTSLHSF